MVGTGYFASISNVCGGLGIYDTQWAGMSDGSMPPNDASGAGAWVPQANGSFHRCLNNVAIGSFGGACANGTTYLCANPYYGGAPTGPQWVPQPSNCWHSCN